MVDFPPSWSSLESQHVVYIPSRPLPMYSTTLLQGFLSFRLEDVAVLNLARKIENQQGWVVLRDLAGGGTPSSELAETQPHHHHLLPCRCEKTAPETCLSNASPEAASGKTIILQNSPLSMRALPLGRQMRQ